MGRVCYGGPHCRNRQIDGFGCACPDVKHSLNETRRRLAFLDHRVQSCTCKCVAQSLRDLPVRPPERFGSIDQSTDVYSMGQASPYEHIPATFNRSPKWRVVRPYNRFQLVTCWRVLVHTPQTSISRCFFLHAVTQGQHQPRGAKLGISETTTSSPRNCL